MGAIQSGLERRHTQADEHWHRLIDQFGLMSAGLVVLLNYKHIFRQRNTTTGWLEASGLSLALTLITLKTTNPLSTYLKTHLLPPPSPPFRASDTAHDGKHHLLLAATGSVATIKLPQIITALASHPTLSIKLILTRSATAFLQAQSAEQPALRALAALPNVDGVYLDPDEWRKPWVRGDAILHIELRRWADLMAIAPLSANSLAKIATGLADDLVGSVVRAWDVSGGLDGREKKGIVVAPAMNTAMWNHPVTAEHVGRLEGEWRGWMEVLRPVEKELACGDTGSGAMKDWKEIVARIEEKLGLLSK